MTTLLTASKPRRLLSALLLGLTAALAAGCGSSDDVASDVGAGGTGWLVTGGNVVPGETIEVRFVIWDTGDMWYDSAVLLDDFTWSVTPSQPGKHM